MKPQHQLLKLGADRLDPTLDVADLAVTAAEAITGSEGVKGAQKKLALLKTGSKVAKTVAAGGAALTAATGLQVAATSGAGIASGLAAAGGIVGGGMAAGPAVLSGGPASLVAFGLNTTVFRDQEGLEKDEVEARAAARIGTTSGASLGILGVGAATVAGGASGPAMMSTLAVIGGAVGGGAIAGASLLVAAPIVATAGLGFGLYKIKKHRLKSRRVLDKDNPVAPMGDLSSD